MDAILSSPTAQSVALAVTGVHLFFRAAAWLRRREPYNDSRYVMELLVKQPQQQQQQQQQEEDEGGESKQSRRARSKSPAAARGKTGGGGQKDALPTVVVTGSSGRIGSAAVEALLETGEFRVRGLDRNLPSGARKFEGVEYIAIDFLDAPDADVVTALKGAAGVIHCAGVVALFDAPALVHNYIYYLTARVMALAKRAGCEAFVATSSTVVINNGSLNVNAVPVDHPYEEKQLSQWGKVMLKMEKLVLKASDSPDDGAFFTCANRFPALFGLNDGLVNSIVVENELSVFPSRTDVRVEMLYMKNAAHAHVCAVRALLDPRTRAGACGRAQNITQSSEGETTTNLEFWQRGRRLFGLKRPFVVLPVWFFYGLALLCEFVYFFAQGMVPKWVIWNFTRTLLNTVLHDNTYLGRKEALRSIGYQPRYTNESSFEDMAQALRQRTDGASFITTNRSLVQMMDNDPRNDVDWEPRPMPKNPGLVRAVFLSFNGPGITWHEIVLFWTVTACSYAFSLANGRRNHFSWLEHVISLLFAGWHVTGAVMSTTATNKRWFHLGGRLGPFLFSMMVFDTLVSVAVIGQVFALEEKQIWIVSAAAFLLFGLMVIVFLVPLVYQRAYCAVLFFTAVLLQYWQIMPEIKPGMEWAFPVMAFKFFVCHAPRHEPYAEVTNG